MKHRTLCDHAIELCRRDKDFAGCIGLDLESVSDDAALIVAQLALALPVGSVRTTFELIAAKLCPVSSNLCQILREDITTTAGRDRDPGGEIASLFFANGLHSLLAYRFTHALHCDGRVAVAQVLKGHFVRAFGVDIMPQATIGRRVWIDHGLGTVIGQTAVVEDDVSLWHGVTLGTNMIDRGERRHPRIERGAVIGAGAQLIGPISIGREAIVAAGSVVTEDVPEKGLAVGCKFRILEGRARSHEELGFYLERRV